MYVCKYIYMCREREKELNSHLIQSFDRLMWMARARSPCPNSILAFAYIYMYVGMYVYIYIYIYIFIQ